MNPLTDRRALAATTGANVRAHWTAIALISCCSAYNASAAASVYKCAGVGRTPVYQESPCASGTELRNFDIDPPALSIVPAPESRAGTATTRSAAQPDRRGTNRASFDALQAKRGDPAERRHAHTGMTEGEVIAKLGRPDITASGGRKGKNRWTYLPAAGDPDTITTLFIDRGAVVDIERKIMRR